MKMKIFAVITAAIMIFCMFPATVFALSYETYYIDSVNGNDLSNGTTESTAWKTVKNIGSLDLKPGDSILFCRGGEYESELTLTSSGTKENPVVISCYGDESKPLPHLYTNNHAEVLRLFDCSFITVSNLEITAPNGGGIWIDTLESTSDGIKIDNLKMHDMQNCNWNSRDTLNKGAAGARACIMVKGLPCRSRYPVNNLTITNCEMYDTGNGISLWGSWNDELNPFVDTPEEVDPIFNENALVKNVYFHDMAAESIIVGICKNALVTNCRSINCCQDEGTDENGNIKFFNASMWFWGSVYSTIEYCEISGQKNAGDGMAVDFDSYSHHCTYQYIYSHDNNCFMCNCANLDGQKGNTVRYCLSVNDNKIRSRASASAGEFGFSFYNNTLINCGDVYLINLHDSLVANNIIIPKKGCVVSSDAEELLPTEKRNNTYKNNCYYNCPNPIFDLNSLNTLPGFIGDDLTQPESFMLRDDSPLINGGCVIENAPDKDFFGNTVVSQNIGCYGEVGVTADTPIEKESDIHFIGRMMLNLLRYLINAVKSLFEG